MNKNILLLFGTVCIMAAVNPQPATSQPALDPVAVEMAAARIVMTAARQIDAQNGINNTDTDTDPSEDCICGGTGRSGDGIGPCPCIASGKPCRCDTTATEESEPDTPTEPDPAADEPHSRVQEILDNYTGQLWYNYDDTSFEGQVKHLTGHGFTAAELDGLTLDQIARLHGAVHSDPRYQQAWSSGAVQSTSNVVPSRSTTTRPVTTTVIRQSVPVRRSGGFFQFFSTGGNCPNGQCPIR